MTETSAREIAAGLSEAQKADLTTNWDAACDCDWSDVTTDPSSFFERQEEAGFAQCVPVTEDDIDGDFAWERGIEIGGSGYHTSDKGSRLDRQKRNAAIEYGWRVLAYPANQVCITKRRQRIVEQIGRVVCGVECRIQSSIVLIGD